MNLVIMSGNISKMNELKGEGDKAVLQFDLAVRKNFVKEGQPDAWFHRCVAFGRTAENISKWFSKGNKIWITGEIRETSWQDENGETRHVKQVAVATWEFGDRKRREEEDDDPLSFLG